MTALTASHTAPELAVLPARSVLAVDGAGAPAGPAFAAALAALYAALGADAPLEGTWWSGDDRLAFVLDRPEGWRWTLAVPAPDRTAAPGPATGVRLEHRPAARVARLVHHGPHEEEGPSLAALAAFVAARGLVAADAHTETYLTDPRTTAPAGLRTELRVPVA
jgi:hypothetical protein